MHVFYKVINTGANTVIYASNLRVTIICSLISIFEIIWIVAGLANTLGTIVEAAVSQGIILASRTT
jgi:hypothetical protein